MPNYAKTLEIAKSKVKNVRIITASLTLTLADSGSLIVCNAADLVVTLPPTFNGFNVTVLTNVLSVGTGTSVSPNASDQIAGNGLTPVDDKDAINSGASDALGDFIEVTGDGSAGWWITDVRGTWAAEA